MASSKAHVTLPTCRISGRRIKRGIGVVLNLSGTQRPIWLRVDQIDAELTGLLSLTGFKNVAHSTVSRVRPDVRIGFPRALGIIRDTDVHGPGYFLEVFLFIRILAYTFLSYIIIGIPLILEFFDIKINVPDEYGLAFFSAFFLIGFWWAVPIVVTLGVVVFDWIRKKKNGNS